MKKALFLMTAALALTVSCSKAPLNEVDGSYFYHENTHVVFEDKGYLTKDSEGNIYIACYGAPQTKGEERDCLNILIPKNGYRLNGNSLFFRDSFDTKIRFFSKNSGEDVLFIHLQQNTRVCFSGTVTNKTENDFFHAGNVYNGSVSLSFSLDDGTRIRLQMNTMTITDDPTLFSGWL